LPADVPAWLDHYIESERHLNRLPGVAIAIVRNGQKIVRGYGLDVRQPVELASLSKPFTAFAIGNLQQEGFLQFDHPVSHYLPQFAPDDPLTVRHLLRHISGFTRDHDYLIPCCAALGRYSLQQTAATLAAAPRATAPAAFAYANSNYMLLAAIVERAAGKPFQDYLRDSVLRPIGMTATSFEAPTLQYRLIWRTLQPAPPESSSWYGSSLLKSTAADMALLLSALLAPNSALGKRLAENHLQPPYDMGWFISQGQAWPHDELLLKHTGFIWSGSTAAVLAPAGRAGAVVLINVGVPRAGPIAQQILAALTGSHPPLATRSPRLEDPDFWGVLLAAASVLILTLTLLWIGRVIAGLRSRRRAFRPGASLPLARAILLLGLALALPILAFGPATPPRPCLPQSAQLSLPLLVAAATLLLLTAAISGLTVRQPRPPQ
jgi:CubicO group peptidase (beta-lactamase class C family)